MPDTGEYDVVVLGGGNAGLCAALSAAGGGARVLVIESAPKALRGGNSRHTRNLRCMHDTPTDILTDIYPEEEFFADLVRVTGGSFARRRHAPPGSAVLADGCSPRCAARCISAAPTRSSWAAGRR
jgi:glycine/D-amino acid oxidase-like deaminating enzyme